MKKKVCDIDLAAYAAASFFGYLMIYMFLYLVGLV